MIRAPRRSLGLASFGTPGSAEEEDGDLSVLTKAFFFFSDLGMSEGRQSNSRASFSCRAGRRFALDGAELGEKQGSSNRRDVDAARRKGRGRKRNGPSTHYSNRRGNVSLIPSAARLIESLSHLAVNVTGLSLMAVDLSGKRLGLLKEAVLKMLSRVRNHHDPKEVASQRIVSAFICCAKTGS